MAEDYHIGQLVQVQARTGTGMNQPGGVGRITNVENQKISVKYVLDGRQERSIDLHYVSAYALQRGRLRDRSMLLGRCDVCGSLRTDCGSCIDKMVVEPAKKPRSHPLVRSAPDTLLLSSSSSDSDSDLEEILRQSELRFRRYQRQKARFAQVMGEDQPSQVELLSQAIQPRPRRRQRDDKSLRSHRLKTFDSLLKIASHQNHQRRRRRRRRPTMGSSSDDNGDESSEESGVLSVHSPGGELESSSDESQDAMVVDSDDLNAVRSETEESSLDEQESPFLPDFVQPEGNASALPADIEDETKGLGTDELLFDFFDAKGKELETTQLPAYKARLEELEGRYQGVHDGAQLATDW